MPDFIVCAYVRVTAADKANARAWAAEDMAEHNAVPGESGAPVPAWEVAPEFTVIEASEVAAGEQPPLWRGES